MTYTRKTLEDIALLLVKEELHRWSDAFLIAFIEDVALGMDQTTSTTDRLRKSRLDLLMGPGSRERAIRKPTSPSQD